MYLDQDKDGKVSINDMTAHEAETISIALSRIIEQLPTVDQLRFRRLLIDLDKLISIQK